jgi:hypothetical protein
VIIDMKITQPSETDLRPSALLMDFFEDLKYLMADLELRDGRVLEDVTIHDVNPRSGAVVVYPQGGDLETIPQVDICRLRIPLGDDA